MQEPEVQSNNNVQQPDVQLTNAEDASEKELESDILDEDNDDENKAENFEGFNGSGRTVTLQMLLAANVLQPGKSTMTIEYLGQKFVGDLLTDGKIKSQETETIFLSPSAWAMHCKRIINPDKKSGCGWASVKYKGRKLDAYKATWMRKCALQKESTPSEEEPEMEVDKKEDTPPPAVKRALVSHNALMNRNITHDANTLVEAVPFSFINKMQPFLVSVSASVLLLADFHCCLTKNEVCGYLGGLWDVNSYTLTITKAYPCCNTRFDREKAAEVELKIQKHMLKDQLILVGWYHSHPKFQAQPTLRDIDAQLDYEIKLRGPSDVTYTPCVGFIFSPYYENNPTKETDFMSYWVIPPTENRQMLEYGRPMSMQYTVLTEKIIPEYVKDEMSICVEYYSRFKNELFDFSSIYRDNLTYLEKLKTTLYTKFPEKQDDKEFWNWICKLLKCEGEDEFVVPKNVSKIIQKLELREKSIDLKEDKDEDARQKAASELKVMSLQEQLCLPSGLNMNPSRLCSPLGNASGSSANASAINSVATATSSPRDSPITIPSNSASPAKFEVPVRASPSPAKSDTSSSRTRNSPAPSPGKFCISDISRNSPSVTPNKYEGNHASSTTDFMAANLASLTGPNSFINDLNAFFQQQKDYGSSSLNQLAAAAAKAGGKANASETFEKSSEISYSQQAFNFPGTSKSMDLHATPKLTAKQETRNAKVAAGTSYKTKLMKELEDLKNDPIKISELMRSPEYAALLLQQAEALGATTLGTLGLGADFSFLGGNSSKKNFTDYSNLLQASKLLGYDSYMQQAKTGNDLNVFFQQQIGGTKKQQQQQQQTQSPDYTALLQSYSKLLETSNTYPSPKAPVSAELSALLNAGNNTPTKKKDTSEMLNQLLQTDKANDLNNLLYHQGKVQNDLNPLFVSPSNVSGSSKGGTDPSSYYTQLAQEKIQDYAALFQQHHGKYGIPDPLSKSTLAANNMFMPPSALLKLQQESLSAMMMKPPKSSNAVSSSACGTRGRESSASPAHERLTPTKSGLRDNSTSSTSGMKYNFSAVDLAISSVQGTSNPTSSSDSGRRPSETPPVDLSRMYQELPLQTKKRMEFSSIAELAAPPSKVSKPNDREENALNLSSSD